MNRRKYLILGVNGMAGHIIAQYLQEHGHTVIGFARQQSIVCKTIVGDARNRTDIKNALKTDTYDVAVNCIGVLNQYVDAKLSDGIYLNSVLPHLLAEELQDTKTKLIHISTDCVYEGTKGSYKESDFPDAMSYYGRSKALGEVKDEKNLTIRTSIVGPELKKDGIGLFHWFMNQTGMISGYKKVIWSGVTTLQLAKTIEADAEKKKTGLYHLVNNKSICKYDLLNLFNMYCRKDPVEIRKNDTVISDKSIINTCGENAFFVPEYRQMVQEMAEWIRNHPQLYGQYKEFV